MTDFDLKFRGVNLLVDDPDLIEWVNNNIPLGVAQDTMAPCCHKRPKLKFGSWWYPWGASRWSECLCLISSRIKEQIGSNFDGTLTMRTYAGNISTTMHMLPPRPLAALSDDPNVDASKVNELFAVLFVDERYWLQYLDTGEIDIEWNTTTWDNLFSTANSLLNVSLTHDSVHANYFKPNRHSDINAKYDNLGEWIDKLCFNTGLRLTRQIDGTLQCDSSSTSTTSFNTNKTNAEPYFRAGGNGVAGQWVPATIKVVFPDVRDYVYDNCTKGHPFIKHNLNVSRYTIEEINVSSVDSTVDTKTNYNKTFHTTAAAIYTDDAQDNSSDTSDLATRIATDYVAWKDFNFDKTYNGIMTWTPEGYNDILYEYSSMDCKTRVYASPYNLEWNNLDHALGSTEPLTTDGIIQGSAIAAISGSASGDVGIGAGVRIDSYNPFSNEITADNKVQIAFNYNECRWEVISEDCSE